MPHPVNRFISESDNHAALEALKTIIYFSIFNYPLKLDEICNFSVSKNKDGIQKDLEELVSKKVIFKVDDYYLMAQHRESIEKRIMGNQMAVNALVKAKERASFIAKFPFVEAVGVSGSLSKGYYDKDSDIDFFVITQPDKVWLCRTFLMLYKKLFLLNSRKYFCINYFMSSANLEVQEKNRFTATEIKTLMPFHGKNPFEEFYKRNEWVSGIFAEFVPQLDTIENIKKPKAVRMAEVIFDTQLGNALDHSFKKITVHFWKIKFSQMAHEDFKVALKSTKHISKHHPLNFQKKVIGALNEKYEEIKRNHNIELPKEYV